MCWEGRNNMAQEIKRADWLRFCKKFNAANRYRFTTLNIKTKQGGETSQTLTPFMGITLSRKGKTIDGLQFLAGVPDADRIIHPVATIPQPDKLYLEKDQIGNDSNLIIRAKDGSETRLALIGENNTDQERYFIEQVAYSLFERRGYTPGNDVGDWVEAEQRVKEAEHQLTE